ncbi:hypothetical protein GS636_03905 [Ruegeria sp. HKCCD4884]|uniref:hypothetical protein n=1 Tax=Ruegeria sp. HKCCD4884 TaxID=2683022 RepID=UPI00149194F6|nr:hypothetical protein [Ruegeria sp. HKCCD4884]NOD91926.1 hypothetical protein [Ruegeria sp. HKCCD4884]
MTTVISRIYADETTAEGVRTALREAGHPDANIDVFKGAARGLAGKIHAARVAKDTAAVYAKMLKEDGATLIVMRAPFTPFGAARNAMKIMDSVQSVPAKVETETQYVRDEPDMDLFIGQKILRDHPRFLTPDMNPYANANRGLVSRAMHWKLLTKHRTKRSAMSGTRFMSQRILPFKLLSNKPRKISVISGGKRMLYNPSVD